jgi:hypothetical protein
MAPRRSTSNGGKTESDGRGVAQYLRELRYERQRIGEEYIRRAPRRIDTECRRAIERELGCDTGCVTRNVVVIPSRETESLSVRQPGSLHLWQEPLIGLFVLRVRRTLTLNQLPSSR